MFTLYTVYLSRRRIKREPSGKGTRQQIKDTVVLPGTVTSGEHQSVSLKDTILSAGSEELSSKVAKVEHYSIVSTIYARSLAQASYMSNQILLSPDISARCYQTAAF